jgi:bile acid:Na+ symporter, BASS family
MSMSLNTDAVIQLLTTLSLGGLLLGVGLRLTGPQVRDALRRSHLGWLLPLNFVVVPLLNLGLIRGLGVPAEVAIGMMLLAASPFAPVVPVFARMARADLALAAALTGVFPFASALLTPAVCELSLRGVPGAEALRFNFLGILGILVATITLPMAAGVGIRHWRPAFAGRVLRPVEMLSEAVGACSLGFVTVVEFKTVLQTGWKPLLAMALASECALALGYAMSGPTRGVRRVTALGTSNRNIALAILMAVGSFAGTPVMGAVVANGLVLILLGLLHVAVWRFWRPDPAAAQPSA